MDNKHTEHEIETGGVVEKTTGPYPFEVDKTLDETLDEGEANESAMPSSGGPFEEDDEDEDDDISVSDFVVGQPCPDDPDFMVMEVVDCDGVTLGPALARLRKIDRHEEQELQVVLRMIAAVEHIATKARKEVWDLVTERYTDYTPEILADKQWALRVFSDCPTKLIFEKRVVGTEDELPGTEDIWNSSVDKK